MIVSPVVKLFRIVRFAVEVESLDVLDDYVDVSLPCPVVDQQVTVLRHLSQILVFVDVAEVVQIRIRKSWRVYLVRNIAFLYVVLQR